MDKKCKCPECGCEFENPRKDYIFGLNRLSQYRLVAFLEGISFLLLLLVAVPIKYFGNEPIVVTYIGTIHGVLFMAFLYFQHRANEELDWSVDFNVLAIFASLVPFGTFVLEHFLEKIARGETPLEGGVK